MAEQYAVLSIASLTGGAKVNFRSTPLPFKGRIRRIVIKADANAAGSATFDFNLEGASVFATEDRPVLPAGASEVVVDGLSIPHEENDTLSVDADALPLGGLTSVAVVVISDDLKADKPAPIEFFIRAMYLGALGREPNETTELAPALASLTAGCFGFGFLTAARTLADAIFTSSEFTSLVLTDSAFVVRLYKAYLNRDPTDPDAPDAGGLAYWTGQVGSRSRALVRADFAGSVEFTNRAPVFCRSSAPLADATSILGAAPATFIQTTLEGVRTVTFTTAALAADAVANVSVAMPGKFAEVLKVETDRAARVRGYSKTAYRTADATRADSAWPSGGEHGVLLEVATDATNLQIDCGTPLPKLFNLDDLSANALLAVTNKSGATATVTVTLTIRLV